MKVLDQGGPHPALQGHSFLSYRETSLSLGIPPSFVKTSSDLEDRPLSQTPHGDVEHEDERGVVVRVEEEQ